ncbi:MAG: asparagine synthase (glutamine-hydrolyzing) [Deltaproteobacteria bacterium]|nr:asparagine synthase (glutamine-hydrolyzing) [Deltaproteobacteria bacterium]
MCGITGIAVFDGRPPATLDQLKTMCDTIYHRGPDDDGMDINGGVALGMRRLSIIDVQGGRQPIFNEDRTIRVIFNGEIYNFRELRRDLESAGHLFRTRTDTETIVHLYEEKGSDFPKYLNGMFAIALHDMKKRKLFLVRDHIGIKPLYYSYNGKYCVWGSEIKSILASDLIERRLDFDALGEFLSWEYVPGQSTLLKSVKKLEPGKMIEIDLDNPSCTPKEYWDVPIFEDNPEKDAADWEEEIDAKLKASVKAQLVSDVPLGAFLSGGVDSSLVVKSMGNAKTFSIGFADPSYNELRWSGKVADHLRVEHITEIIEPDAVDLFDHLIYFLDDPIGDFSIFPTFLVSRLARKHVTVALSGDGGDELFGGYETYMADIMAKKYQMVPSYLRLNLIEPCVRSLRPRASKKGFVNKLKRFVEGLENAEGLSHARWRLFIGEAKRKALFTDEAYSALQIEPSAHIFDLFRRAGKRNPLNRSLYVDLKSYLTDNILVKVDRMSMAVSLEARVPYLDKELVELAFRMPDHLKVTTRQTKILLKKVAARYIPSECVYRPKEGFSIPVKNWLGNQMRPLMEDLLDSGNIGKEGIFNPSAVEQLKKEHLAGVANHSHVLWSLMVFQAWRKRWLG